jgi:hypothetical protein
VIRGQASLPSRIDITRDGGIDSQSGFNAGTGQAPSRRQRVHASVKGSRPRIAATARESRRLDVASGGKCHREPKRNGASERLSRG